MRLSAVAVFLAFMVVGSVIPAQDRPPRAGQPREGGGAGGPRRPAQQRYSIEQAISDKAQLHTIAFSGLAFVTGEFGASTFLPPGKVCDYFGFQYMRDIDQAEKGHNPMFLDRITGNVMQTLTVEQRAVLEKLAREQAPLYRELAEKRWPLIKAFCLELNAQAPEGMSLCKDAVIRHVADLFAMDADMSARRAEVVGGIIAGFSAEQKATLAKLKFGDFGTWPAVDMQPYKLPRGTEKLVNVAYMTYASELFSWYAGSVEADVYFCPERHGTYFGGFYMKDMPAMGKRDYDISTSVTGDSGQEFLRLLSEEQRGCITGILAKQRAAMREIVDLRRAISTELRVSMQGKAIDKVKVAKLGRRYGELDGEVSYLYASAFAKVNRTLTDEQRKAFMKLRNLDGYTSAAAYTYSAAFNGELKPMNTATFFTKPAGTRQTAVPEEIKTPHAPAAGAARKESIK